MGDAWILLFRLHDFLHSWWHNNLNPFKWLTISWVCIIMDFNAFWWSCRIQFKSIILACLELDDLLLTIFQLLVRYVRTTITKSINLFLLPFFLAKMNLNNLSTSYMLCSSSYTMYLTNCVSSCVMHVSKVISTWELRTQLWSVTVTLM